MKRSRLLASVLATGNLRYRQTIKNLFGASLIGYWPMDELSGATALDYSGNGRNGVYTDASLANVTGATGRPVPLFNGTASRMAVYSASLNGAFSGSEGTLGGWAKMQTGAWSDGVSHNLVTIWDDASNYMRVVKVAGGNNLFFTFVSGGAADDYNVIMDNAGYFHWSLSWSATNDRAIYRVNGAPIFKTGLAAWTGTGLDSTLCFVGSHSASLSFFSGWLHDVFLLNREMTDAEAVSAATGQARPKRIAIIGDSISANDPGLVRYHALLSNLGYNSGFIGLCHHAAGGNTIMANMDTQTAAAASDDADIIIVALGTNDNDAGDMTALQAEYAENLAEMKVSNPRATIYAMNVLPRWTDNTGAVPVDKSHIRAAIAAACTAQGVTCWDTFLTPWITAADTSDGLHPTAAGHAKIAAQVLARL